jgi:hypothetical protein
MTLQSGEGRRAHQEDAIFGGIMGILAYVDAEFQRDILSMLLPSTLLGTMGSLRNLSIVKIEFWPKIFREGWKLGYSRCNH